MRLKEKRIRASLSLLYEHLPSCPLPVGCSQGVLWLTNKNTLLFLQSVYDHTCAVPQQEVNTGQIQDENLNVYCCWTSPLAGGATASVTCVVESRISLTSVARVVDSVTTDTVAMGKAQE